MCAGRNLGQRFRGKLHWGRPQHHIPLKTLQWDPAGSSSFCSHPSPESNNFHHCISPFGNSCSELPEPLWLCPLLHLQGGPFTQGGAINPQMVASARWLLTRYLRVWYPTYWAGLQLKYLQEDKTNLSHGSLHPACVHC